jgi:pyrroline-5-carboxylate reductase
MPARIVLVGCGNMGGALIAGWRDRGVEGSSILVIEPDDGRVAIVERLHGVGIARDLGELGTPPEVVIIAVKPQVFDRVLPACERFSRAGSLVLSIAAGKTIGRMEAALGASAAIVRAMPNMPAAIGRGMTVACASGRVDDRQREVADDLLSAVGDVAWVEDERLLDPITAVSGSGPAYVFLLVECLARAGVAAGLPADLAEKAARVTVAGAGELLHRSLDDPQTLRQNVTSPGGTTAAALGVLMAEGGLDALLARAIEAATRRARELADG